jgi:glycerol transport system ATP-binding protein
MAHVILKNISHAYNANTVSETQVLKDINLDIPHGSAHALLGASGTGKTTLLKIISGLLVPTRGDLMVDGQQVNNDSPRERNIAQVFQFPVLYEHLSVYDNLAFPLRNRRVPLPEIRARIKKTAALLEIDNLLSGKTTGLSIFNKQKVSLGRALVRNDVSAILLDEPLTAVEPSAKWRLRQKLKELQQELCLTMIYVTHDQLEAMTFAEQISVMHEGRIIQTASPRELVEKPQHEHVGYFIGMPGMNFLPAGSASRISPPEGATNAGFRPDQAFVSTRQDDKSLQVTVIDQQALSTHLGESWGLLTCKYQDIEIRTRQHLNINVGSSAWLHIEKPHFFRNGWRMDEPKQMAQTNA